MSGSLTRSFGLQGSEDLVVELRESGEIAVRKEPVDRRLKRGEQLPEVCLNVQEVWDRQEQLDGGDVQDLVNQVLDRLVRKIPIASFEGIPQERVDYRVKVWLQANAAQIIQDLREKGGCS